MRRRLSLLLLLALMIAGCSADAVEPTPQPDSQQVATPVTKPEAQPSSAPGPAATPNTAPKTTGTISDLQSKLSEADSLLVAGQNREAADLLLKAVGAHPDSPAAWDLLTLALIRLGEPQVATRTGARAVQLQPEGATIRFNTGYAHLKANEPLQAAAHLKEAARLNQVRPEPLIYLALVAQGDEAQAALQELEARFPGDPAVQMVRSALALGRGDLDGDGKPEVITKGERELTITNGATGWLYLKAETNHSGVWTYFGLMGDEGERFVVINNPLGFYTLYHLVGNQFVPVADLPSGGTATFDRATRELDVFGVDRSTGTSHSKRYTWKGGALVQTYNLVTPSDKGPQPPPEPLPDDVELFLATMKWQQKAYTSPALVQEVMGKDTGKWGLIPFLLPTGSGYRLELWHSQRPPFVANATVTKERRIEKLTWE